MATCRDKLEDMDLSRAEVDAIAQAMKDEQFRQLLSEYVDEISDPENRKVYEAEMTQLEKERGVDVKFLNPEPCYVLKTSVDGDRKAFVNVCKNDNIETASCKRAEECGYNWSIPYSLAPPKEDLDKEGAHCLVYDVLFHPDTIYMSQRNAQFKKMIESTAMDGIEANFNAKLDRRNVRYPKIKFKGVPTATVIRKPSGEGAKPNSDDDQLKVPYPDLHPENKIDLDNQHANKNRLSDLESKRDGEFNEATKPKYVIKYRKHVDVEDFSNPAPGMLKTVDNYPKELVIEINLPLLKTSVGVELDVTDKFLKLESQKPAAYSLNVELAYSVDSDNAKAKFDIDRRLLVVTLPVNQPQPTKVPLLMTSHNSDARAVDANASHSLIDEFRTKMEIGDNLKNKDEYRTKSELQVHHETIIHKPKESSGDEKYRQLIPDYDLRQDYDELIFVLRVRNICPDSVSEMLRQDGCLFSVTFKTIGSGFVPFYYSLIVKCPQGKYFDCDGLSVDTNDDNMIIRLGKGSDCVGYWNRVLCGARFDHLHEVVLTTMSTTTHDLEDLGKAADEEQKLTAADDLPTLCVTNLHDDLLEIIIEPKEGESVKLDSGEGFTFSGANLDETEETEETEPTPSDENKMENKVKTWINISSLKEQRETHPMETSGDESPIFDRSNDNLLPSSPNFKVRSLSESSDDLTQSPLHRPKGILKLRHVSRSISESSDEMGYSSTGQLDVGAISSAAVAPPATSDIPEESSADDDANCANNKKSVRFNDVVHRSLFRTNSSILGQRKKNQRKQRSKKRLGTRRTSESETSEGEWEHSEMSSNCHVGTEEPNSATGFNGDHDREKDKQRENGHDDKNSNLIGGENGNCIENDNTDSEAIDNDNEQSSEDMNANEKVVDNQRDNKDEEISGDTNGEGEGVWKVSTTKKKKRKGPKTGTIETVLSWNDDTNIQKNRPNSGMDFSNSLMYDLDV